MSDVYKRVAVTEAKGDRPGIERTSTKRIKRLRRKKQKKGLNIPASTIFFGSSLLIILGICAYKIRSEYVTGHGKKLWQHKYELPPTQMHANPREREVEEFLSDFDLYAHSDMMPHIGDKSEKYAQLREKYDEMLPINKERMKYVVHSLREREYNTIMDDEMTYDIHNCPFDPPEDYPFAWNVTEVLDNWPPDDPTPRPQIYQGLCVFDFETERDKAMNYREFEVPFIVRDDPQVLRTTERWNQPGYMDQLLGDKKYRTEYSPNNHFMYWNLNKKQRQKRKKRGGPGGPGGPGEGRGRGRREMFEQQKEVDEWKPPTKMLQMSYQEWLSHANVTDESKLGPDMEHWYYRLIGCGAWTRGCKKDSEYLFDELAFFQPREDNDLYMVEPEQQKGIHCRFGMRGVIAENHFDATRNMIAIMKGERRYILAHPDECQNLALYKKGHPSSRHSAVDWSNPDWKKFPQFLDAEVNEVVLQPGDVLYLPTYWFHYIISLELNFQCNTRSGASREYEKAINDCGF